MAPAKKAKHSDSPRQKQWPLVTSSVCDACPIRCPAGVRYMETVSHSKKAARGVVCKRTLFEERIKHGLPPFEKVVRLWKANQ
ncbi:hypothetical protein [Alicyclobacillus fastidiosus]|uniref:4Fe-4S ferredoxin-type domain-containing protein n=1 Tax=Alicyclobacillus fastidiosus TaxID=392011 RepID=A0ABV5ACH1_9BACL